MRRLVLSLLVSVGILPASPAQPAARPTDPEGVPLPVGAVARFGSTRFRHRDMIQTLAFSPGGRTLFAGTVSHDALYAWDAATGRLRWRATFAQRAPGQTPAGRMLDPRDIGFLGPDVLVVLPDGHNREGVARFDRATGKETGRVPLDPPAAVGDYRFSRDGSRVAVGHEQDLAVYDTATGRRLFAKRADYAISHRDGLDFSPDGGTLAVGDAKGGVHLLRSDTGRPVRDMATGHGHSPVGVRFAGDGRTLAVRPMTVLWNPVLLLDPDTGAVRHRLRVPGDGDLDWHVWSWAPAGGATLLTACRVYPDGGGLDDAVVTWDAATGKELRRFPCALPYHTAVSPDGRVLATADGFCVELLDLTTGKPLPQSADPVGGYDQLRHRPDGRWVALGPSALDTFDGSGRRLSRLAPADPPGFAAWGYLSPDGTRVARFKPAAEHERCGPVEVWDTAAGKRLATFGREESREPVPRLHREGHSFQGFSPDGAVLYTRRSTRGTNHAWETATGKPVERPAGTVSGLRPAAVSPDGRWAAVIVEVEGVGDGRRGVRAVPVGVQIADAATGRAAATLRVRPPRVQAVAFSPDGRTVAVVPDHQTDLINGRKPVSDDLAYLFEIPSGREVGRLRGPDGSAMGVTFSPDGRTVVTTGLGGTARLWEVATLGRRHAVPHGPIVRTAAFSRDGRLLAADGSDAPAYLWDVYGDRTRTGPRPDAAALDAAWADLAGRDAAAGFRAVRTLVAAPGDSVRLLGDRLKPEVGPDPAQVRRWVADLDSPAFAAREKATAELTAVADRVAPALREALAGVTSPEASRRLEAILSRAGKPSPEVLRVARGLEALEAIGTPDAARLLGELARGPAGHRLTAEAKRSLDRAGAR